MKRESSGQLLSTVFVDYDNIYLSLKRKSEEAAKRFAKDAAIWLREIENGRLITATNGMSFAGPRRIVMNRCYGNPVPRRNQSDNSTDMSSFPFVRHHFLKAGFEVIDCPPLTAQLKNSSDIRMVMDVRDYLNHDTYFEEFIILSGDADFTPVLHRLRAHARRTVVFANDYTAAPYTAISDGEVRESDLISLLLEGRLPAEGEPNTASAPARLPSAAELDSARREIVAEVVSGVRAARQPVPLEALADRAVRTLGHERTVGSAWGGTGSFRDLLMRSLPEDLRISDQPPYYVYDISRQIASGSRTDEAAPRAIAADERPRETLAPHGATTDSPVPQPARAETAAPAHRAPMPAASTPPPAQPLIPTPTTQPAPAVATRAAPRPAQTLEPAAPQPTVAPVAAPRPAVSQTTAPGRPAEGATAIQQSIARIHEACQAPPLSPPEYRVLFEVMAKELATNGLTGSQTLVNIAERGREMGLELKRDDLRFVLDVVSEADPWFEQGVSANLFASRFRNFVVARCRSQGLSLSVDELDLIEAWFAGASVAGAQRGRAMSASTAPAAPTPRQPVEPPPAPALQHAAAEAPAPAMAAPAEQRADRWWSLEEGRQHVAEQRVDQRGLEPAHDGEEFPRIVRTRLRG